MSQIDNKIIIAKFVVSFINDLTGLMSEHDNQLLQTIGCFFKKIVDENKSQELTSSETWKLDYVYRKLQHIAESNVSLRTNCDSTKLEEAAVIIAKKDNPNFLDILVCLYGCFPSVRLPSVSSTHTPSKSHMRSPKMIDKPRLIDELMTAAVDDVQIYLPKNRTDAINDYFDDDDELGKFAQCNTDIIQTIANRYKVADKLLDFIKRRLEHYENATSFEVVIKLRHYVLDGQTSSKSLADFLHTTNRVNVLSTEETQKYTALFDSYAKKFQSTQETMNQCMTSSSSISTSSQDVTSTALLPVPSIRTRRALLIGNNAYKKATPLRSCINDASNLQKKLDTMSFRTTLATDLNDEEMDDIIDEFLCQVCSDDLVFFFFAGYGIQWDNQYFLLPVNDDRIKTARLYKKIALNVEETLKQITHAQPFATILILDCPHSYLKSSETMSTSFSIEQTSPHSLVVCNWASGKSVVDISNDGHHSVFTSHLLDRINQADLSIDEIMSMVCAETKKTDPNQNPFQINLIRDIKVYLNTPIELKLASMTNRTTPSLQTLPVELVYRILDNVSDWNLIFTMHDICIRINQIRDSYSRYQKFTTYNLKNGRIFEEHSKQLGDALRTNKTLTALNLTNNTINGVGIEYLANGLRENQTLVSLNLTQNQIGIESGKHLGNLLRQNQTLSVLNLQVNFLSDAGVKYLADGLQENRALTSLNLTDNKIQAMGAKYLATSLQRNRTLTSLNLDENDIGDEGAKDFADVLQQNQTLAILDLTQNQIGAEGATHLFVSLQKNQTVTSLSLKKNRIGDKGLKNLPDSLRLNQTLTSLNLQLNQIHDVGAEYLGNSLRQNNTLKSLNLKYNEIAVEGAKHLADALRVNQTLTILDLFGNKIGTDGTKHLADSLRQNRALTSLNLYANQIGDNGAKYLADCLRENQTLTLLDIGRNEVTTNGAKHLADSLLQNQTLTSLNLCSNKIDANGVEHFVNAQQQNNTLESLDLTDNLISIQCSRYLDNLTKLHWLKI